MPSLEKRQEIRSGFGAFTQTFDFTGEFGAGDGGRTRDIYLGKVALYH